jgi:hypothetical protein
MSIASACKTWQNCFPVVDDLGGILQRSRSSLRELDKTLVIHDKDKPLAVPLKYEYFLAMQEKILEAEGQ